MEDVDSDNILDYANAKVREIFDKNGAYKEGAFKSEGVKIEERALAKLESNAKYKGQWSDSDQRHGYGTQVWSDGSMYQGYW